MAFDLFKLLNDLDNPNKHDKYIELSDENKKGFSPLVIMRWMSGTSDTRQIMLLNEFVNSAVFPLGKHPHLLMLLLQSASSKTPKRYRWLGIKNKSKKNSEASRVVEEYYDMTPRDVSGLNPFPCRDSVLEMAESLGWTQEEIKKLKNEYKKA